MSKSRYAQEQEAFGSCRRRRAQRFLRSAVSRSSVNTFPTICHQKGAMLFWVVGKLEAFLPEHPGAVIECFGKLTDNLDTDRFTVQEDAGKNILKAGLESSDEDMNRNARRALENLLRRGRSEFLDIS